MMASPGKKSYPLRLDPAVFEAVERAAAADFRSTNNEIEMLLREALARRGIKISAKKAATTPSNQDKQE
jgi:hypothetical protein